MVWLDAMIYDHGLLRFFWNRPTQFTPDAWRSNQPTPQQLVKLAREGLRTVISLRGLTTGGASILEVAACKQANLELIAFKMSSRGAPDSDVVLELLSLFERVETPVLFHCKSGADRSGFAAALYLLFTGQGTIDDAKSHLSWRYLHFRGAKTGMLFAFLEAYERYNEKTPIRLKDWVRDHYDPRALRASFQPRGFSAWFVDKVLRRE
ncbi:tyrosine-protein phosphatase [Salinispirillum marinum]|uniref:Tyrosine-protein phosphatase n=2 Tax=Saccharospirillaceae TaxID=255527 RepID=A0ABV8BI12_9GAMM